LGTADKDNLLSQKIKTKSMPHPVSPRIWLSENAFISMVSASIEAFPEETLGILLGLREPLKKRIVVQYAVVYQTAKRARNKVKADPERARRLDKFLEKVTFLEVIGDFHSHPNMPVRRLNSCWLSDEDKNSMSEGDLGFVIAIDRDYKERDWCHLSKGSLLGSVFPYSMKISGWYKTANNKFKISKIHCPFALGLGR
jgi:proteasome lid subunit RPN8/RPN11